MDSPKKDELRERRREEGLARRMGEALDRVSPGDVTECPEPDVIAAYHERALGPEETVRWEDHFARCSRCRKILAVLGASIGEPLGENEVAHLGELVATAARSPQPDRSKNTKPVGPNRWDWRARWLAPALGVAATVAVWFAVRPPWRTTGPASSGTLIAQAPKNEPQAETEPADRLSKVAPPHDQKAEAMNGRDRSTTNTPPLNSPPKIPAERGADTRNSIASVSPDTRVGETTPGDEKKLGGLSDNGASRPATAPAPPPPTPKSQRPMEAQASSQGGAAAESSTAITAAGGAPQAQANADAAGNVSSQDKIRLTPQPAARAMVTPEAAPRAAMTAQNVQNLSTFKTASGAPALMKSPSGSALWRVGKGGSIERSSDRGRTWTAQTSPSSEDWLAGDSVSDTIGWLVGRNGAIARTTDGEHWVGIAPPRDAADSSGKSPDWTAITAQDSQMATITARDGRRFATRDGGKTWQPQ